jgi:hypothetical protein
VKRSLFGTNHPGEGALLLPANKAWDDGYGAYTWPLTGERFVSVTAFLSVIAKPALTRWAAKMAAEYAVTARGVWEGLERSAAVEQIKMAPFRTSEQKRDLGSRVHEAVEAWTLGKPFPEWDADVAPYMQSFRDFLEAYRPAFEASEFTVYSRTHRYAGTGDILAWMGEHQLWLLDVKTGKWAYPEAALQLSAYAHGEFIGVENQFERDMPKVDRAGVLLLSSKGYRMIPLTCSPFDETLFEGFLAARDLWHWQTVQSGSVFPQRES